MTSGNLHDNLDQLGAGYSAEAPKDEPNASANAWANMKLAEQHPKGHWSKHLSKHHSQTCHRFVGRRKFEPTGDSPNWNASGLFHCKSLCVLCMYHYLCRQSEISCSVFPILHQFWNTNHAVAPSQSCWFNASPSQSSTCTVPHVPNICEHQHLLFEHCRDVAICSSSLYKNRKVYESDFRQCKKYKRWQCLSNRVWVPSEAHVRKVAPPRICIHPYDIWGRCCMPLKRKKTAWCRMPEKIQVTRGCSLRFFRHSMETLAWTTARAVHA